MILSIVTINKMKQIILRRLPVPMTTTMIVRLEPKNIHNWASWFVMTEKFSITLHIAKKIIADLFRDENRQNISTHVCVYIRT